MFKLRIMLGNSEIDMEGEENSVKELFNDLRSNGLGEISKIDINNLKTGNSDKLDNNSSNATIESRVTDIEKKTVDSLPALENIMMKDNITTEKDWILVCALYCSKSGQTTFTGKALRNKYLIDAKRDTRTRQKNYRANLKKLVKEKDIVVVNKDLFRIEKDGISKARQLVS